MRTDIFARLDREPEPPKIEPPRMSRHRIALFGGTLAFYLAIVIAVLIGSWLVTLDWKVMLFRPYQQWPGIHAFLDYYVVLGQRGPTAVMVACWLGWRSWRQHTLRPLLTLGASLLLLNLTVGAVKLGLGRLGPHYATQIGSAELFAGGDIFPSGHTANAVVTWGILAYLATTPRARRYLSAISAVVSLGVGLTTVYLGTHWLSDVLLGWAAGLLILLGLPWVEPLITRAEDWIFAVREQWRARGRAVPSVPVAAGGPRTVLVPQRAGADAADEDPALEPVAAGSRTAAAAAAAGARPRAHAVRSERTPITPAGSRRPPHADRTPRGGTSPARPVSGG
ncbi:phosphatase PAP2 family protein [Streptomyces sp. NBC_01724]|uniref:phosphatase PAP2 family protein n=1 Tax=unclassified Streptomyces TaxID=2593676 RepID=UPI0028C4E478|nr:MULTISPECIES: phosphatase PAP2 family protein [unclassified Streptomyces]WNO64032.1 phosphatase PAP2 family protein [Streptomyces sp. AM2-3-1]WSC68601.1 phosphatase PAP2 family protein [Streptomyces sp. NBC_01760]WTE58992.1 phosphatase PAP2 family protein [Streptomyces sp. NBC_01617]WTI86504.1 phosphatase PAP2 family protein [Streptomyces sp. NBC_00724]